MFAFLWAVATIFFEALLGSGLFYAIAPYSFTLWLLIWLVSERVLYRMERGDPQKITLTQYSIAALGAILFYWPANILTFLAIMWVKGTQ